MTLDDLMQEATASQLLDVQQECIAAVRENALLRKLLWLRHDADHFAGLYGDDGEMACGACGIDFKRLSAADIAAVFYQQGNAKLAAYLQTTKRKP